MTNKHFGTRCSPFDPYSRAQLGWIHPIDVTDSLSDQAITDYISTGLVYRLWHRSHEYFLVSNHKNVFQPSPWEEYFPGKGLLVWHVDTTGSYSEDQDDYIYHKLVDLEAADGLWEWNEQDSMWVENDSTGRDSLDIIETTGYERCFFNSTTRQAFNDTSNPTTDGYVYDSWHEVWKQTVLTGVSVNDIQGDGGDTMWADLFTPNPNIWWGPDTVHLTGDFVVEQGTKLGIMPGTVVMFDTTDDQEGGSDSSKCELIVKGTLEALGTEQDSIYFISACSSPSDSDWYGFTVESNGAIDLSYCTIEDAFAPIPWDSVGSYELNHVKIKHCYSGITVGSSMSLSLSHCSFEDNTNGIVVASGGSLHFDTCSVKYDNIGIIVQSGGSATLTGCLIRDAQTGVRFNNLSPDSVIGCTFRDNAVHGLYTASNDSLLVDDCVFVDSTSDTLRYGILCRSDLTVKNSFFEGYEYGIKVLGSKGTPPSPLIEDCGFYNIVSVGIWSTSAADPTIKKSCFKGSYGKACIQIDGGNPYVEKCYMASQNGEIPIGMLFTGHATGTVRRTTIWDYDNCAVQIDSTSNPDLGNADSIGCNWFEETDHNYLVSLNPNDTILAKSNYWDVNDGDTAGIREKIVGQVDIDPILGNCDHCFPYYSDQCSDLPPSDPEFDACKIVAEEGGEGAPGGFFLSQNYPNPFNPQTVIKYDLPQPAHVKLTIYNVLGQKVKILVDEHQESGGKTFFWEGKNDQGEEVASGMYFFRFQAGEFEAVKQMILLR